MENIKLEKTHSAFADDWNRRIAEEQNVPSKHKLRGVGFYSEIEHRSGQEYTDKEFQEIRGTKRLCIKNYTNAENPDRFLVVASGITIKSGSRAQRNAFCEESREPSFLHEFYKHVLAGAADKKDSVVLNTDEEYGYPKLFEEKVQKGFSELEQMKIVINEDIKKLKTKGIFPSYYAPVDGAVGLMERLALSGIDVAYDFNDIPKPGAITFYRGAAPQLYRTKTTEDALNSIEAELKRPKFEPQLKAPSNKPWYKNIL